MPLLSKWMMATACAFLMMHTFVPHNHHRPAAHGVDYYQSENKSIIDFLAFAFDLDQGEDHLENFERSQSSFDFATIPVVLLVLVQPTFLVDDAEISNWGVHFNGSVQNLVFLSCSRFRGPPRG